MVPTIVIFKLVDNLIAFHYARTISLEVIAPARGIQVASPQDVAPTSCVFATPQEQKSTKLSREMTNCFLPPIDVAS